MTVSRPSKNRIDAFISVVAVLDDTVKDPAAFVQELHQTVSGAYTNYELVLVVNGTTLDNMADVRGMLAVLPCVRILRLSRRFSIDIAIFAGLDAAIGDYVVNLTPDFDPVRSVVDLVALAMQGNDVIQGLSLSPTDGGWPRRVARRAFFGYNRKYLHVDIPENATYLICLTRRAMNSLTNASRSLRYLHHMIRHIGYRLVPFKYSPLNSGQRPHSMRADVIKSAEMITSYSSHPLRLVTLTGVLVGVANVLYAIYVIVLRFVSDDVAAGWTTISLQLSGTFFIFSLILAVLSEYVGRVLAETRKEPLYFIMEEWESDTLLADIDRRNISS